MLLGSAFFAMTFGDRFDVPTFGGDVGPAFAPRLFLGAWILLSAIALGIAIRNDASPEEPVKAAQFLGIVLITLATAVAMTKIGFVFATVPGFAAFCWAFHYRRPVPLVLLSVAAPVTIWALFTFVFELLLPRSPWFHAI